MHRQFYTLSKFIFYVIFQAFFVINLSYSDHLTAKVTGFVDATSPIHVLGYDRKYFFEKNSAPLFIVIEQDINKFNKINLKNDLLSKYSVVVARDKNVYDTAIKILN